MAYNPVKVIDTNNWYQTISKIQSELEIYNPIIVSSLGTSKRNNLDKLFSSYFLFTKTVTNPTIEHCQLILNNISIRNFDSVIAIGGGSVLDTAKVILAALKSKKYDLELLLALDPRKNLKNNIPSIFVPTTHGTGSEVTMWATIWDMVNKKKYSISHPDLYPDIALLDPKLTISLPFEVSISTISDALSHSFEALWNKNSTNYSTSLAVEAICIILKNIENIIEKKDSLIIKKDLLNASCLAGKAISITKTAAAHSMSYPLTIYFNIPHGIAASLFLNNFIEICKTYINNELKNILFECGLNNIDELKKKISYLLKSIKKDKLSDWGIEEKDIDILVEESNTKARMENFLLELNQNDIRNIYLENL